MKHLRSLLKNISDGGTVLNGSSRSFETDISCVTDNQNPGLRIDESESFFSSVIEGIGDGLIVLDKDYIILTANKGYLKQVERHKEEVIGRHCYEISHNVGNPCFLSGEVCAVKKTFETGGNFTAIHRHIRNGGSLFHVETRSFPIRNNSGDVISAVEITCDISEKITLEEELKKRVKDLEDFYEIAVGRELKMVELKNEIRELNNEMRRYKAGEK